MLQHETEWCYKFFLDFTMKRHSTLSMEYILSRLIVIGEFLLVSWTCFSTLLHTSTTRQECINTTTSVVSFFSILVLEPQLSWRPTKLRRVLKILPMTKGFSCSPCASQGDKSNCFWPALHDICQHHTLPGKHQTAAGGLHNCWLNR